MAGKAEPQTNCNRNVFNCFVMTQVIQTTYRIMLYMSYMIALGEIGHLLN